MATTNPFPQVTVNLAITLSPAVIQDIHTHWLSRASGQAGTLAADVADADTTLTLSVGASSPLLIGNSGAITPGATILVGNDPLQVVSIDGSTLTVKRYPAAFPFMALSPVLPTTTHKAGDAVLVLANPDPWTLIANEALRPWAQQVVLGLGAQSATFGSAATGSLTVA